MSEPLPQYQIDHIVSVIRSSLSEIVPRQQLMEGICTSIRQELNSPTAMTRFENLLNQYYKSNSDIVNKFDLFHQTIVTHQTQIAGLLKQILDGATLECPNNPDLELIRVWLEEILVGDEYKLKQQVRDLLESGFARKLRNVVITYITITALMAITGGIIGYFALTSAISKDISTEMQKVKNKEVFHGRTSD